MKRIILMLTIALTLVSCGNAQETNKNNTYEAEYVSFDFSCIDDIINDSYKYYIEYWDSDVMDDYTNAKVYHDKNNNPYIKIYLSSEGELEYFIDMVKAYNRTRDINEKYMLNSLFHISYVNGNYKLIFE